MINNISGLIDELGFYKGVISRISLLKEFLNPGYRGDDIQRASSNGVVLSYSRGDERLLRRLMKDDFPEKDKDWYLEFVSEMTKNAIREICQKSLKKQRRQSHILQK